MKKWNCTLSEFRYGVSKPNPKHLVVAWYVADKVYYNFIRTSSLKIVLNWEEEIKNNPCLGMYGTR